jgi:hypothetical protein
LADEKYFSYNKEIRVSVLERQSNMKTGQADVDSSLIKNKTQII